MTEVKTDSVATSVECAVGFWRVHGGGRNRIWSTKGASIRLLFDHIAVKYLCRYLLPQDEGLLQHDSTKPLGREFAPTTTTLRPIHLTRRPGIHT